MEEQTIAGKQISTEGAKTAQNVTKSPYVSFWVRFAAFSIDSAIVSLISFIGFIPIGILLSFGSAEAEILGGIVQLLFFLMSPAYFIYFTHKSQSTWGKRYIGIKVLAEDGYKLGLGKIVLRETVGRIVNMFTMYIGYIIAVFTAKKQGLHDMISGSVVVPIDPQKEISRGRVAFGVIVGFLPLIVVGLLIIGLASAFYFGF